MNQNADLFIEDFYRKNYRVLYIHAYSILGKKVEAEAAVQEAFVVACQKLEELMSLDNPLGWMKSVVRYKALHILEDQKRTVSLFTSLDMLNPSDEPSHCDQSDSELVEFCQQVVSKDEFAFFLRIAQGASTFLEEATERNIKPAACYKQFERIRNKLQQVLREYDKTQM